MNELSLFSGAGGGLLASKLLGWKTIGYVEHDDYCQQVIRARIDDGTFDEAPIFTDVEAFAAVSGIYRGLVDVVSGGFPCTDIAVCKQDAEGIDGDRSGLWSAMRDVICTVRPKYAFLENSPAILVRGFERVANDLAEMGYSFKWGVLGANHVGYPHKRARWWCVATDSMRQGLEGRNGGDTEGHRKAEARSVLRLRENQVRVDLPAPELFRVGDGDANRSHRLKAIGNAQVPECAAAAWRILSQ